MFTLCRSLIALTLSLLLAFSSTVYAQSGKHTPASPPSSIHFAGVNYHLISEENKEGFNYGKWHYRPTLQLTQFSHLPELILNWRSDEWISDTFDEDSCPPISENYHKSIKENKKWPFLHVVFYNACYEIYTLKDEYPGVIYTTHENEHDGEILISSIIAGKDEKSGDFVKLTLSRYIPIPINHYDYIDSMLHYAYTVTGYGSHQEQAIILQEKLNQEGEQWLKALLEAPMPQFILDRTNHYENCKTYYGDKGDDECPW